MEKTVIEGQENNGTETVSQERTFTQSELNGIIENRLKKENAKYSDYEDLKKKAALFDEMEEAKKSELQKANEKADALQKKIDEMTKANEITAIRNKIASESGVPANLLNGDTEETCKAQAEAILAFAKPNTQYPNVKDGGEAMPPTQKQTSEQKFADWFSASMNN